METLKPIEGQINWNADHMPTPLNYARYVDSVERVAESIELDDVLFAPVVRCVDCNWFTNSSHYGAYCTNFGAPLHDDYDGYCAWAKRKEGK